MTPQLSTNVRPLQALADVVRLLEPWAPALGDALVITAFGWPTAPRGPRLWKMAPDQMRQIRSRGRALSSWSWGAGRTALLVHGWNGRAQDLEAFVAPLVASGHRVIAFDQPSHGTSSGRQATLVDFTASVRHVAEAWGGTDALVGHSLGASAAVLALADGMSAQSAALLAPPVAVEPYLESFAGMLGLSPERRERVQRRLAARLGLADLSCFDLRLRARELTALPGLILHDRGDREVPFDHGRQLAEAWPGARFRPLDGTGHRKMLTAPSVVREVVDFLSELRTARRAS